MNKQPHEIRPGKGLLGGRLLFFETLSSTNRWAIENIIDLAHGDTVLAVNQTAGLGRFDRKWVSAAGRSLTISIIIQPARENDLLASSITQITALAVAATLEKFSVAAMVKWPNDVLAGGRKIAGILAERDSATGKIVTGIGINVNMTAADFAGVDMLQPATSLQEETGQACDIDSVLGTLLKELAGTIKMLTGPDAAFPRSPWKKRDFLKGRQINVHTEEALIAGVYSGIDGEGRLTLTDATGRTHAFWSGDVSLGSGQFKA